MKNTIEKNKSLEGIQLFETLISTGKEWFSTKEVAKILSRSEQFVRDAIASNAILGHYSYRRDQTYHKQKSHARVHRKTLAVHLLRSANHNPEEYTRLINMIIAAQTIDQLIQLQNIVEKTIQCKQTQKYG